MPNLFPDFQTFLRPGTKAGKLAFIKYAQNNGVIPGTPSLLEADFVRPNSAQDGTKSAATVLDANGNLLQLAVNVPMWNVSGGLTKLNLYPQLTNLLRLSPTTSIGGSASFSTTPGTGILSSFTVCRVTASATSPNIRWTLSGLIAGRYQALVYYKTTSSLTAINADIGDETVKTLSNSGITSGNWNLATAFFDRVAGSEHFDLALTGVTSGQTVDIFCCLYKNNNQSGFIPPIVGSAITRNQGTITIPSTIVNGSFTMYADIAFADGGLNGDNAILFRNNTTDKFALWGLAGGMTIRDSVSNSYPNISKLGNGKIVISFDGQRIKYYYSGAKQIDHLMAASHVINRIDLQASDNNIILSNLAYSNLVVAEAAAIAHVS